MISVHSLEICLADKISRVSLFVDCHLFRWCAWLIFPGLSPTEKDIFRPSRHILIWCRFPSRPMALRPSYLHKVQSAWQHHASCHTLYYPFTSLVLCINPKTQKQQPTLQHEIISLLSHHDPQHPGSNQSRSQTRRIKDLDIHSNTPSLLAWCSQLLGHTLYTARPRCTSQGTITETSCTPSPHHPIPTYLNQSGRQSSLCNQASPSVNMPVTQLLHLGEFGQLKYGICWYPISRNLSQRPLAQSRQRNED